MDAKTRAILSEINRRFYRDHAKAFSDKRSKPWSGWERVIDRAPFSSDPVDSGISTLRILDVGCGNGRFGEFLDHAGGWSISYSGVDASRSLLRIARKRLASTHLGGVRLEEGDIVDPEVIAVLSEEPFHLIGVFGVLHHLPDFEVRLRLLQSLRQHLAPEGILALSFWQFGQEDRFRRRAVSWSDIETLGLCAIDEGQLEAGDYLLRWGPIRREVESSGEGGCRYCHFAGESEIDALVARLDLFLEDSFSSDGSGDRLNRYVVLRNRA